MIRVSHVYNKKFSGVTQCYKFTSKDLYPNLYFAQKYLEGEILELKNCQKVLLIYIIYNTHTAKFQ